MRNLILAISLLTCISYYACAQKNQTGNHPTESGTSSTVVLLNNLNNKVPLKQLDERKIASMNTDVTFDSLLNYYADITPILPGDDVNEYNTLIVEINDKLLADEPFMQSLKEYNKTEDLILVGKGPYTSLAKLNDIETPIIWTTDTSKNASAINAQVVFGGIAVNGVLPMNVSANFKKGDGNKTEKIRLGYTDPDNLGINGGQLTKEIDAIAKEMIDGKAAPGAVVMAVKDGHVIFEKAYGNHYYDKNEPMSTHDIFDLASVTKIAATTLAVMKLEDENKIDLTKTMGYYLEDAAQSNKKDVKLQDVMLHQGGFIPYIPFYRELTEADYRTDSSAAFPTKVGENYYLRKNYYEEVMWPTMLSSKVKAPGEYVYSDISMYVMQHVIEKQTGMPEEVYVKENFYDKLGMYSTGFNPWQRFPQTRIVPTELDKTFRKSQLIGYVHDQGAAMAGGVAGHAGLFATANDLAIYGQLLLNKGTYGGENYIKPATIEKYTVQFSDNSRRGLGFDRWSPEPDSEYPSKFASPSTFGHTGYTGTCIWIDPDNQLVYIFLSNRVQPTVSPYLGKLDIRSRIQDAIYKAISKK
ncbi:serine hydrolase domain-containing protein [Albibacterium indicum]|uniref:serine hydrolase domain-containing protein n=1 Tax=Albibacterium indicum TaxID=2292082 RepID=UPI000E50F7E4|nr:serine hydrolase domain-containing protein [Pedobacter indicus]